MGKKRIPSQGMARHGYRVFVLGTRDVLNSFTDRAQTSAIFSFWRVILESEAVLH